MSEMRSIRPGEDLTTVALVSFQKSSAPARTVLFCVSALVAVTRFLIAVRTSSKDEGISISHPQALYWASISSYIPSMLHVDYPAPRIQKPIFVWSAPVRIGQPHDHHESQTVLRHDRPSLYIFLTIHSRHKGRERFSLPCAPLHALHR